MSFIALRLPSFPCFSNCERVVRHHRDVPAVRRANHGPERIDDLGVAVGPTRGRGILGLGVLVQPPLGIDRHHPDALTQVQQSDDLAPLWRLLDDQPALIPMMVVVLDEAHEQERLVALMDRYFPDPPD